MDTRFKAIPMGQMDDRLISQEVYKGTLMLILDNKTGEFIAYVKKDMLDLVIERLNAVSEGTVGMLRAHYFALRDKVWKEGETGYSKVELHDTAKAHIFPKLIENPDNFVEGAKDSLELSVTWLSKTGWESFIEEFKLHCAENFNFYL